MGTPRLLVIDAEPEHLQPHIEELTGRGYRVDPPLRTFDAAVERLASLRATPLFEPIRILLNARISSADSGTHRTPNRNADPFPGLHLLDELRRRNDMTPVVMYSTMPEDDLVFEVWDVFERWFEFKFARAAPLVFGENRRIFLEEKFKAWLPARLDMAPDDLAARIDSLV